MRNFRRLFTMNNLVAVPTILYIYISSVKCLPNGKLPVGGSKDTMASPNFKNLCNGMF